MKDKIIESGWKVFLSVALFTYTYFYLEDVVLSVLIMLTLIGLAELGYSILSLLFYSIKYLIDRLFKM